MKASEGRRERKRKMARRSSGVCRTLLVAVVLVEIEVVVVVVMVVEGRFLVLMAVCGLCAVGVNVKCDVDVDECFCVFLLEKADSDFCCFRQRRLQIQLTPESLGT
jgi:hypothetical protein